MKLFLFLISLVLFQSSAWCASSATTTRAKLPYNKAPSPVKYVETVSVAWTAAADGTFTDYSIRLCGFVLKVITNPGATAPTANYDIDLGDPNDDALDALAGALANRHTTNTEQVAPVLSGGTSPVFLCGTYTLGISNNAVNAATGVIIFYLVD